MCGIAGIIGRDSVDEKALHKMADVLRHRGPDDEGFHIDGSAGLAHRRLSIIDIDGGKQPLSNEDGTIWIAFNGEIYNFRELRRELVDKGHIFATQSDTEVIVHLYEELGRDCVKKLRGMFAFAIWDSRDRSLFLARDPMGQKPLFFHVGPKGFLFASEPKAILATGIVQPKPDLNGLWHYISLRFLPDRYTLFEGIQKLQAGSRLEYRDGKAAIDRYWSIDFNRKRSGSDRELIDGLHEKLRDTVKSHMVSDVPVGAFLSGGIDSSTITAMMDEQSDDRIPAFSIGVAEQKFNELPFARTVANGLNVEHHEQIVRADLIHLIPSMVYHMDEPSDPFGVGVYLVSQMARERVKVALGGDGGDENFAGYDRYSGNRLVDYYCWLPRWFRANVMGPVTDRIPQSFGYKSLAQKAAWVNEMSFSTGGARYAHSASFLRFTEDAKNGLFTPDARRRVDDPDSVGKILAYYDAENASDETDRMLHTDLMTRMPDHLLPIVDRMAMAHSLEVRSPLVDQELVALAASLPANMKLRGRTLKYALRSVAGRYLPASVIDRPKQGFGFPLALWMRDELSGFLRNLFAESRFVELGLFDRAYMNRILDEHLNGRCDHNFRLWILINLEIWYRLFFEGRSLDQMREFTDGLMTPHALA